nr:unnamed protein product [Callosobruchus chinensis]
MKISKREQKRSLLMRNVMHWVLVADLQEGPQKLLILTWRLRTYWQSESMGCRVNLGVMQVVMIFSNAFLFLKSVINNQMKTIRLGGYVLFVVMWLPDSTMVSHLVKHVKHFSKGRYKVTLNTPVRRQANAK